MSDFFDKIEVAIGYNFKNRHLLRQALTHKSFSNEQAGGALHNERLEFLGDAVLELAISEWVFCQYPDIPEGGLRTQTRGAGGQDDVTGTREKGAQIAHE